MNGLPNGPGSENQDKSKDKKSAAEWTWSSGSVGGMYATKLPYVLPPTVQLPDTMYPVASVAPINKSLISSAVDCAVSNSTHDLGGSKSRGTLTGSATSTGTDSSTDAMNSLEERQLAIIEKLKGLQEVIKGIHLRSFKSETEINVGSQISPKIGPASSLLPGAGQQLRTNENIDIVLHADPNHAPYSLLFFANLYEQNYENAVVSVKSHMHSSFKGTINLEALSIFNQEKDGANFKFTLIWKNVPSCTMIITPVQSTYILGKANMARFLSRLLPNTSTSLNYDCLNWENLVRVDSLLEFATEENVVSVVERELKSKTIKTFLIGNQPTIADLVLYSSVAAKLVKGQKNAATSVRNWFKHIEITFGFHNSE